MIVRILGLLSLVLALAIVGLLFNHQQGSASRALPSGSASAPAVGRAEPTDAQARQIQQQIKQSVDAAMQTSRPMPDDN